MFLVRTAMRVFLWETPRLFLWQTQGTLIRGTLGLSTQEAEGSVYEATCQAGGGREARQVTEGPPKRGDGATPYTWSRRRSTPSPPLKNNSDKSPILGLPS